MTIIAPKGRHAAPHPPYIARSLATITALHRDRDTDNLDRIAAAERTHAATVPADEQAQHRVVAAEAKAAADHAYLDPRRSFGKWWRR